MYLGYRKDGLKCVFLYFVNWLRVCVLNMYVMWMLYKLYMNICVCIRKNNGNFVWLEY